MPRLDYQRYEELSNKIFDMRGKFESYIHNLAASGFEGEKKIGRQIITLFRDLAHSLDQYTSTQSAVENREKLADMAKTFLEDYKKADEDATYLYGEFFDMVTGAVELVKEYMPEIEALQDFFSRENNIQSGLWDRFENANRKLDELSENPDINISSESTSFHENPDGDGWDAVRGLIRLHGIRMNQLADDNTNDPFMEQLVKQEIDRLSEEFFDMSAEKQKQAFHVLLDTELLAVQRLNDKYNELLQAYGGNENECRERLAQTPEAYNAKCLTELISYLATKSRGISRVEEWNSDAKEKRNEFAFFQQGHDLAVFLEDKELTQAERDQNRQFAKDFVRVNLFRMAEKKIDKAPTDYRNLQRVIIDLGAESDTPELDRLLAALQNADGFLKAHPGDGNTPTEKACIKNAKQFQKQIGDLVLIMTPPTAVLEQLQKALEADTGSKSPLLQEVINSLVRVNKGPYSNNGADLSREEIENRLNAAQNALKAAEDYLAARPGIRSTEDGRRRSDLVSQVKDMLQREVEIQSSLKKDAKPSREAKEEDNTLSSLAGATLTYSTQKKRSLLGKSNSPLYNAFKSHLESIQNSTKKKVKVSNQEYLALYKAAKAYVNQRDSGAFTDEGKERFLAAAKVMAMTADRLFNEGVIDRKEYLDQIQTTMIRSEAFRDYYLTRIKQRRNMEQSLPEDIFLRRYALGVEEALERGNKTQVEGVPKNEAQMQQLKARFVSVEYTIKSRSLNPDKAAQNRVNMAMATNLSDHILLHFFPKELLKESGKGFKKIRAAYLVGGFSAERSALSMLAVCKLLKDGYSIKDILSPNPSPEMVRLRLETGEKLYNQYQALTAETKQAFFSEAAELMTFGMEKIIKEVDAHIKQMPRLTGEEIMKPENAFIVTATSVLQDIGQELGRADFKTEAIKAIGESKFKALIAKQSCGAFALNNIIKGQKAVVNLSEGKRNNGDEINDEMTSDDMFMDVQPVLTGLSTQKLVSIYMQKSGKSFFETFNNEDTFFVLGVLNTVWHGANNSTKNKITKWLDEGDLLDCAKLLGEGVQHGEGISESDFVITDELNVKDLSDNLQDLVEGEKQREIEREAERERERRPGPEVRL